MESGVKLERNIVQEIIDFLERFAALVSETQAFLEEKPKILLPFYRYLKILIGEALPDESGITYDKLFNMLDNHWHYLKYQLLQRIIKRFLSDTELPYEVQKYQDDIVAFKKSTKMRDLVDNVRSKKSISGNVQVALTVEEVWLEVTLEHFEFLVKLLFQEYDKSLQIVVVQGGSLYIAWSLSKAFLLTKSKFDYKVLRAIGVISLIVGTIVVFNNEDSQDDMTIDSGLLGAIQSGGPLSAISLLLEVGGNPNLLTQSGETVISTLSKIKNDNGTTVLHVASKYGHSSVVSTLLSNGIDPNVVMNNGCTPLMLASQDGHDDVIQLLLKSNVAINTQGKNGITANYIASQNGHFSVVSTLLSKGADPNLVNNDGWTPLMAASKNGHNDVIEILLKKGIMTNTQNKYGRTAIYIATQRGHSSVVTLLLNNGADPNIVDNEGWTPLMVASLNGQTDVFEILLEKNIPVNTQNNKGITAICIASHHGHSSVVSTLLNNGADPNVATNDGWTPLMTASINGHTDVIEILLNNNVLVNTQNNYGRTAILLLARVVTLLLSLSYSTMGQTLIYLIMKVGHLLR